IPHKHWRPSAAAAFIALCLGSSSTPARPERAEPSGGFVVTAKTGAGRLRVGAVPGDLGLRNRRVTAIVRKADGYLVDFWTNQRVLPTAPQLRDTTNADGLWQVTPFYHDGSKQRAVRYDDVRSVGDTIVATGNVRVAGARLRIETSYRLTADEPEVVLTTRFRHLEGGSANLKFQEGLKWGNADYFVEGVAEPLTSFEGRARSIGRQGLCGDLKWIRLDSDPFHLEFKQTHPGLAPQILTTYELKAVKPDATPTFTRKLRYEALSLPPPSAAPSGVLRASVVDELGRALPAKLSFEGTQGTKTPNFGNDGNEAGVNRFVWSGSGHFERTLPAGNYRVLATAGPERGAERWNVSISAGNTSEVSGKLPRLIETPGWISGDLHLHQVPSVDADLALSTRLIAVAAEGIELAVATDHYAVTDFAPTVAQLVATGELAQPLATIVGSEVSTVGNRFGHFNLFPMQMGDFVNYTDTTAKAMFAEMRQVAPEGVLQVNHPRWPDLGYFQVFQMDPKTHRVPVALRDKFVEDFDALEVFNGLDAYSHPRVRLVLRDWIAHLGRGFRYTATGNSDSHKLAFEDPGLPRNLIFHGGSTHDDQDVYASEGDIIAGIKHGHVLVTNGPYIDVKVGDKGPGDTVKSDGKPVLLEVLVRAVPWVDVSQVEVLVGAKADRIRAIPVPQTDALIRYQETVKVPGYAKTFVIVVVSGKKPLENVYATGVRPLAFTNPIWIEP
ncbi:MAG TPA: CehA/McbA family metallohydrolase, partial [Polyangiaceae bacterium]|nr:CehA/McbA family metallohydrolase [Polyangiaceae bacterium]